MVMLECPRRSLTIFGCMVRRSLRRRQVMPFFGKLERCLIGIEACGTSHFWAREIAALGHEVKLMPPAYVKPYVKRGKTDAGDAEAICEAVTRPTMRFVPIKSADQQSVLALHRTRDLLVRQRTQLVNMIRAQLAEFGIVLARGIQHVMKLVDRLVDGEVPDIPPLACKIVIGLAQQIRELQARIDTLDHDMMIWFRGNELAKRLDSIPGIGVITASALAASVADPHRFGSARQFAASLGLTPKANSSGGRERMGRISKMGDRHPQHLDQEVPRLLSHLHRQGPPFRRLARRMEQFQLQLATATVQLSHRHLLQNSKNDAGVLSPSPRTPPTSQKTTP